MSDPSNQTRNSDEYLKVRNSDGLIRQKQSNAILTTNADALAKYKEKRRQLLKLNIVVEENEQLKQELAEIKSLLQQLLGQQAR